MNVPFQIEQLPHSGKARKTPWYVVADHEGTSLDPPVPPVALTSPVKLRLKQPWMREERENLLVENGMIVLDAHDELPPSSTICRAIFF